MNGETTFLKDPSNNKPPKSFNFDHSFHSMNSKDDCYASQELVYNSLGKKEFHDLDFFNIIFYINESNVIRAGRVTLFKSCMTCQTKQSSLLSYI